MSEVVQRAAFTQGGAPVGQSPLVWKNAASYEVVTFIAIGGTISKVEASPNDVDWVDITANTGATGLLNVITSGVVVAQLVSFKAYRITYTGTLYINAN